MSTLLLNLSALPRLAFQQQYCYVLAAVGGASARFSTTAAEKKT